jgi:hypothetical protein
MPYGPPPQRGTNGFAIAALVLGLIGGMILGAILGFVALAQIRRSGQQGRGLAIAGIITSGIWTLLFAIGVIAAIAGSAQRDGSGTVTGDGGTASVDSIAVGDCLNDLPDGRKVRSLSVAPCDQPHTGEVFGTYDSPAGTYPGQEQLQSDAERRCPDLIDGYAPGAGEGLDLFTLVPTDRSWRSGDRSTQCIAATDTPRSGSIRIR